MGLVNNDGLDGGSGRNETEGLAVSALLPEGGSLTSALLLMLYDRPYMRYSAGYRRTLPMYGWILIVLAVVFLFQNLLQLFFGMDGLLSSGRVESRGFLPDWFALSEPNLGEFKLWTLLTYSLFHGGILHLLFNSLAIFFVGRIVEMMIGPWALLKLFIFSALGGALVWALANLGAGEGIVIGASAGALGIVIYFCARKPNEPVTVLLFLIIPVTILPKWLGWGLVAIESFGFIFSELSNRGSLFSGSATTIIAHSAHLGGMAAGYLFFRYERWFRSLSIPRIRLGKGKPGEVAKPHYRVNVSKPSKPSSGSKKGGRRSSDLREEVDRILDKINASGFGSLSSEEKETLNKAKELLKK